MFLSALDSRYESDGSLTVDLRGDRGPIVRYGPYVAGMPWFRWTTDRWIETSHDAGARLVNRAHESRDDLPVLRYLQCWPQDLVRVLYPVWHAQSAVMQVCARHAAALDLARSNLVLLWLAAARYAEDAHWHAHLGELLRLPQRELLATMLGLPDGRPGQVRLLRKIVLMEGTHQLLRGIRELAADEDSVMAFRHWSRLPSSLVPLARGPLLRHLHWLRDELGATDDHWLLGQMIPNDRIRLLRDTSRMLEGYARGAAAKLVTRFCHDWDGVQRVHDALIEITGASPEPELDVNLSFGPPPIPSDEHFHAITTVGELHKEGKAMRHCVSSRSQQILAGECYVYRVNVNGERATLQIAIKPDGLVIDEFRLRANADPSPEAWAAVRIWLERNSTEGAVRPGTDDG